MKPENRHVSDPVAAQSNRAITKPRLSCTGERPNNSTRIVARHHLRFFQRDDSGPTGGLVKCGKSGNEFETSRRMTSMFESPLVPMVLFLLFSGQSAVDDTQAAVSAIAPADAIVGEWLTAGGVNQARLRISREGGALNGEVVWLYQAVFPASEGAEWEGKPKTDRLNPDPALRARPIVGLLLLEGFRYRGNQRWGGGTIYDPESGKTYKCKLTLSSDDVLDVRGFVGIALIGRTTRWTRAPEPEGLSLAGS